jgi:hypothetical protein
MSKTPVQHAHYSERFRSNRLTCSLIGISLLCRPISWSDALLGTRSESPSGPASLLYWLRC